MANDTSYGTEAWVNVNNAKVSDNSRAVATLINQTSNYLKATNFGFSIPSGATIDGIEIKIERLCTGDHCTDGDRARIVKSGTIGSSNKIVTWPSTEAIQTLGSSTDLWGETWTVDDINASTTGFVVAAKDVDGGENNIFSVDHITMTVYYTEGASTTPTPDIAVGQYKPSPILINNSFSISTDSEKTFYEKGDVLDLTFSVTARQDDIVGQLLELQYYEKPANITCDDQNRSGYPILNIDLTSADAKYGQKVFKIKNGNNQYVSLNVGKDKSSSVIFSILVNSPLEKDAAYCVRLVKPGLAGESGEPLNIYDSDSVPEINIEGHIPPPPPVILYKVNFKKIKIEGSTIIIIGRGKQFLDKIKNVIRWEKIRITD